MFIFDQFDIYLCFYLSTTMLERWPHHVGQFMGDDGGSGLSVAVG